MGAQALSSDRGVVLLISAPDTPDDTGVLPHIGGSARLRDSLFVPERPRLHRAGIVGARFRSGDGAPGVHFVLVFGILALRGVVGNLVLCGVEVPRAGQLLLEAGNQNVRSVRHVAFAVAFGGRGVDSGMLDTQWSCGSMLGRDGMGTLLHDVGRAT